MMTATVTFDRPRAAFDPHTDNINIPFDWVVNNSDSAHLTVTQRRPDGTTVVVGDRDIPNGAGNFPHQQFGLGLFTATITAVDDGEVTTVTHDVTIVDDDPTPPSVAFDRPRIDPITDGDDLPFTWGSSPDVASARLVVTQTRPDGTVVTVHDGAVPREGAFPIKSYGLGYFLATLTVTDNDNDWPGDSLSATATHDVTVVDDDTTPPTAAFDYPRLDPLTDEMDIPFTWGTSVDVSSAHLVVTHTRPDGTTATIHDGPVAREGEFPIRSYGLGYFRATLVATDNDNDRPGDSQSVTATHDVTVVDDDTAAPTAAFDYPRLDPLTDALEVPFSWGTSVDVTSAHLVVTHTRPDGTTVTVHDGAVPREGEFPIKSYGLGYFRATLVATDDDNDRPGDSQSVTVTHDVTVIDDDVTAPVVAITSLPDAAEVTVDQPRRFDWSVTDDQTDLAIESVRITRDTGSGPEVIYENPNSAGVARFDLTPYGVGTFRIEVTGTDRDNDRPGDALSTTASRTLRVVPVQAPPPPTPAPGTAGLENDPSAPGRQMLVVRGTEGSDKILVSRSLAVTINGQNRGSFGGTPVSRVVVHALGGNDFVWMADYYTGNGDSDSCVFGRVSVPTFLYGGAGYDLLVTGNAGGAVVGGADNDLIVGGAGRDVTIGGDGADLIVGLANDDVLVAGYTAHDGNDAALYGIFREWNRTDRGYLDRIRALKGETSGLNGLYTLRTDGTAQNVFDDGEADEVDLLVGGDGNDWYLFNTGAEGGAKDVVLGSATSEVKSDIDMN